MFLFRVRYVALTSALMPGERGWVIRPPSSLQCYIRKLRIFSKVFRIVFPNDK
jgi:hypothetical protein